MHHLSKWLILSSAATLLYDSSLNKLLAVFKELLISAFKKAKIFVNIKWFLILTRLKWDLFIALMQYTRIIVALLKCFSILKKIYFTQN